VLNGVRSGLIGRFDTIIDPVSSDERTLETWARDVKEAVNTHVGITPFFKHHL